MMDFFSFLRENKAAQDLVREPLFLDLFRNLATEREEKALRRSGKEADMRKLKLALPEDHFLRTLSQHLQRVLFEKDISTMSTWVIPSEIFELLKSQRDWRLWFKSRLTINGLSYLISKMYNLKHVTIPKDVYKHEHMHQRLLGYFFDSGPLLFPERAPLSSPLRSLKFISDDTSILSELGESCHQYRSSTLKELIISGVSKPNQDSSLMSILNYGFDDKFPNLAHLIIEVAPELPLNLIMADPHEALSRMPRYLVLTFRSLGDKFKPLQVDCENRKQWHDLMRIANMNRSL